MVDDRASLLLNMNAALTDGELTNYLQVLSDLGIANSNVLRMVMKWKMKQRNSISERLPKELRPLMLEVSKADWEENITNGRRIAGRHGHIFHIGKSSIPLP
jgi:hypothetical protein